MDISDAKGKNYIFNIDVLEKEGAWGLFHELGHNRQNPSWSKLTLIYYFSHSSVLYL